MLTISFLVECAVRVGESPALNHGRRVDRGRRVPSSFSLHLTFIFRIFYNPGRQLDPVVVILLNGKIRD